MHVITTITLRQTWCEIYQVGTSNSAFFCLCFRSCLFGIPCILVEFFVFAFLFFVLLLPRVLGPCPILFINEFLILLIKTLTQMTQVGTCCSFISLLGAIPLQ